MNSRFVLVGKKWFIFIRTKVWLWKNIMKMIFLLETHIFQPPLGHFHGVFMFVSIQNSIWNKFFCILSDCSSSSVYKFKSFMSNQCCNLFPKGFQTSTISWYTFWFSWAKSDIYSKLGHQLCNFGLNKDFAGFKYNFLACYEVYILKFIHTWFMVR